MLYVLLIDGRPVNVTTNHKTAVQWEEADSYTYQCHWDWEEFSTVQRIARLLTAALSTDKQERTFLPVDCGEWHSPRGQGLQCGGARPLRQVRGTADF